MVVVGLATMTLRLLVLKLYKEFGKGAGYTAIENVTELDVLPEIQPFFLNKCSSDCCKLLVDFQGSIKIDFDDHCQCSHCLYGGADFWRFSLCHFQ